MLNNANIAELRTGICEADLTLFAYDVLLLQHLPGWQLHVMRHTPRVRSMLQVVPASSAGMQYTALASHEMPAIT